MHVRDGGVRRIVSVQWIWRIFCNGGLDETQSLECVELVLDALDGFSGIELKAIEQCVGVGIRERYESVVEFILDRVSRSRNADEAGQICNRALIWSVSLNY